MEILNMAEVECCRGNLEYGGRRVLPWKVKKRLRKKFPTYVWVLQYYAACLEHCAIVKSWAEIDIKWGGDPSSFYFI
jgi:hypothetical protein